MDDNRLNQNSSSFLGGLFGNQAGLGLGGGIPQGYPYQQGLAGYPSFGGGLQNPYGHPALLLTRNTRYFERYRDSVERLTKRISEDITWKIEA